MILVLRGVSLNVLKGGITAILGGNGAGKSTTLKAISNLLHSERGEVTKGTITYRDHSILNQNPSEMVAVVSFCKNIKRLIKGKNRSHLFD